MQCFGACVWFAMKIPNNVCGTRDEWYGHEGFFRKDILSKGYIMKVMCGR